MKAVVFGAGATGARVARQLCSSAHFDEVEVRDPNQERLAHTVGSLGGLARAARGRRFTDEIDVAVIATPVGSQATLARLAVHAGIATVTTSDDLDEVRSLLELDHEARYREIPVIVGAGFMPGLTCLLARHAARELEGVDELHVAKVGTGGPACARQHHRSLSSTALDWRDGRWTRRPGGSGRELAWFPDPVGGRDCYRAALPDAVLLVPAFPGIDRVTARMAATRRDRLTAPLPMLRPPHAEGGIGAVRVEARGRVGAERRVLVFGAVERPAVAAGAVAATVAIHVATREVEPGSVGLAGLSGAAEVLRDLAGRGVHPARFEGMATFS